MNQNEEVIKIEVELKTKNNIFISSNEIESVPKEENSVEKFGGKGKNLVFLSQHSLPVPPFNIITTRYFTKFIEENNLQEDIKETLKELIGKDQKLGKLFLDYQNTSLVSKTAKKLRDKLDRAELPKDLVKELQKHVSFSNSESFSVRSSASQEDLEGFSFAGQYETFLNVSNFDDLIESIKGVYVSTFSDHSLHYRLKNGFMDALLDPQKKLEYHQIIPKMAIIIQEMIEGYRSGVLFTVDLDTSDRTVVTINSCFGIGEGIVSGAVESDLFKCSKGPSVTQAKHKKGVPEQGEIVMKKIVKKTKKFELTSSGVTESEVPKKDQNNQTCTNQELKELTKYAMTIESFKKDKPQDIEWTIDTKGKIWILQTRDVTTLFPDILPFNAVLKPGRKEFDKEEYLQDNKNKVKDQIGEFNHIFQDIGGGQQFLDPFRPLGRSSFEIFMQSVFGIANKKIKARAFTAGQRMYLDISDLVKLFSSEQADNADGDVRTNNVLRQYLSKEHKEFNQSFISGLPKSGAGMMVYLLSYMCKQNDILRNFVSFFTKSCCCCQSHKLRKNYEAKSLRVTNEFIDSYQKNLAAAKKEKSQIDQSIVILEHSRKAIYKLMTLVQIFALPLYQPMLLGLMIDKLAKRNVQQEIFTGLEGNITTEMSLMIEAIAETLRSHDDSIQKLTDLTKAKKITLDQVFSVFGTSEDQKEHEKEFLEKLKFFFSKFGIRSVGEIDFTNPSFSEEPKLVIQMILTNLEAVESFSGKKRFEESKKKGLEATKKFLDEMKKKFCFCNIVCCCLPNVCCSKFIKDCRMYQSIREHPKYYLIKIFRAVKKEIDVIGELFVQRKLFDDVKDIEWFTLDEIEFLISKLNETEESKKMYPAYLKGVIEYRKEQYIKNQQLDAPVMLSNYGQDLENANMIHQRILEERELKKNGNEDKNSTKEQNVWYGIGCSNGIIEGHVRVIHSSKEVDQVKNGEILVTRCTDPSFTTIFTSISGLILSVGGAMTHGAVVAREMGLPCVCGIIGKKIFKNGDFVRVNGTNGKVELLKRNGEDIDKEKKE